MKAKSGLEQKRSAKTLDESLEVLRKFTKNPRNSEKIDVDRYLISGTIALLILQVTILLGDMGYLPSQFFSGGSQLGLQETVGEIIYTNQNVRRRRHLSIMWENSRNNDQLFNYDSVLTLSQSSAKLHLRDDIKIHLHENTLIVIEPPADTQTDQFRLKFSRGNLRTQTQTKNIQLGNESWSIDAKPGSDLSLRSVYGDKVELEVKTGQVQLQNKKDKEIIQDVSSGQKVTFDKEEVEKLQEISQDLNWKNKDNQRFYGHQFPIKVDIQWTGDADQIRVLKEGQPDQWVDVKESNNVSSFPLNPGSYYFQLQSQEKTSETLSIHVVPSPKMRYFSPLPRDRVESSQSNVFSWAEISSSWEYRVELSKDREFRSIIENHPTETYRIDEKIKSLGPLYWRVVSIDEEGNEVAPQYSQRIYSVTAPLAAPKLRKIESDIKINTPPVREPASKRKTPDPKPLPDAGYNIKKGKWQIFWDLFFSKAQAAEVYGQEKQLIFSWYPVPDADYYIIEISSNPDFQNPEVIEEVRTTKFVWTKFEKKPYYWRVAAGQDNGRMGLFSEPQKADLAKIKFSEPGVPTTIGVPLKPDQKKLAKLKPEPIKPEDSEENKKVKPDVDKVSVKKEEPPAPPPKPRREQLEFILSGSYNFSYHFLEAKAEETKATLTGVAPISLDVLLKIPMKEVGHMEWLTHIFYTEWRPEESESLPFQDDLESWEAYTSFVFVPAHSRWGYGLSIEKFVTIRRESVESIDLEDRWAYGLDVSYRWDVSENAKFLHHLNLLYGDAQVFSTQSVNQFHFLFELWQIKMLLGLEMNLKYYQGEEELSGLQGVTGLKLGVEW